MYLSPYPDCWGGIARRRHSHGGQSKSGQIFKLLLQSSGFSFITIADATSLPCWPSFWKGRENSFKKALDLFLPNRLEIYGEYCQFRENSVWLPLLTWAPPSSPAQLPGDTSNLSLLLSRKHCWNFPHKASCIHLTDGCRHLVISQSAVSLQHGSFCSRSRKTLDAETGGAGHTSQNPGYECLCSDSARTLTPKLGHIGWSCYASIYLPVKLKVAIKEINNKE